MATSPACEQRYPSDKRDWKSDWLGSIPCSATGAEACLLLSFRCMAILGCGDCRAKPQVEMLLFTKQLSLTRHIE
jgi:hypothetical protein